MNTVPRNPLKHQRVSTSPPDIGPCVAQPSPCTQTCDLVTAQADRFQRVSSQYCAADWVRCPGLVDWTTFADFTNLRAAGEERGWQAASARAAPLAGRLR